MPGRGQPSSVLNQSGRLAKIVDWTQQAWLDIQNRSAHWRWMQGDFEGTVMTAVREYSPDNLNATRFGEWIEDIDGVSAISLYETVTDEAFLPYWEWSTVYAVRLRGVQTPSRPDAWSVKGKSTLFLATIPDQNYTIRGIYRKAPQVLAANDDVPEMPSRFHDLIWMEAMGYAFNDDESYNQPVFMTRRAKDMMSALERDQLPEISDAEALA